MLSRRKISSDECRNLSELEEICRKSRRNLVSPRSIPLMYNSRVTVAGICGNFRSLLLEDVVSHAVSWAGNPVDYKKLQHGSYPALCFSRHCPALCLHLLAGCCHCHLHKQSRLHCSSWICRTPKYQTCAFHGWHD